jgi:histidinol dehydrogenase
MWKEVGIDAWLGAQKTSLEDARMTITEIIDRVWKEGDDALRDLAKKYVELTDLAVSEEEFQKPKNHWFQEMEPGIVLGMKTTALDRVGIYIPGGRAAYPSSALM